jgi:CRP-like cAMP-binding protein
MADRYLDERTFGVGDVICAQGDLTTEMFIIQEGKVAVTRTVKGREIFVALLDRGDFFGEMALLNSQPRHATCFAMTPTRVLALRSGELLLKLRRDPTFALEMLRTLSQRIRYLDDQVAKLLEREMVSREDLARMLARTASHRAEHIE